MFKFKALSTLVVFCLAIALLSALHADIISYDEVWAFDGLRSYLWHAITYLGGSGSNYKDIYSNAEYYGVLDRAIPILLFLIQRTLLFGNGSVEQVLNTNLSEWVLTGYTQLQHVCNVFVFLLGCFFVLLIAKTIDRRSWPLAVVSFLTLPVLVGHSVFNARDIFTMTGYTAFTFTLIFYTSSRRLRIFSSVGALSFLTALVASQKIVLVAPLCLTYVMFEIMRSLSESSALCFQAIFRPNIFLRILCYLALTAFFLYVLTPASWQSPIEFTSSAFALFSRFDQGGDCSWLLGQEFCLLEKPYLVAPYIFGWVFIHLPLHLVIGLIILSSFAVRRLWSSCFRLRFHQIRLNSQYFYLLAQALLVPALAIVRGSNLYDSDRHLLFIYPPIIVLSSIALLRAISALSHRLAKFASSALNVYIAILSLNLIILSPYQYVYANELVRPFIDHRNTTLDYWAVSSREIIQNSILHGWIPLMPDITLPPGQIALEPPPLAYAVRSLGGRTTTDGKSGNLFLQYRNPAHFNASPSLEPQKSCREAQVVERQQLFFSPLMLSRLLLCK